MGSDIPLGEEEGDEQDVDGEETVCPHEQVLK